ncbi:hypothetical protein [Roseburia sp. 1XD42-34]|uniref:hypothetical protein n=1 Tax=Roseburia sp. 1XD42-34 TaxID=2305905 RepID=UPI000EA23171|nr:hypothetical protein [Roseburia sp. 1XD42-34]NBJ69556.1 hypothetical protein [Roseburia sp. 1XD42-34]RKI78628.1 hypothetical protein D7V87_08755 [Clostridium sp. 1xD42-85]
MKEWEEWWENYLISRKQKEALRTHIKDVLQKKAKEYRTFFDECFYDESLYDKHSQLKSMIRQQFDGKAKRALIERLEMNTLRVSSMNIKRYIVHDSIQL